MPNQLARFPTWPTKQPPPTPGRDVPGSRQWRPSRLDVSKPTRSVMRIVKQPRQQASQDAEPTNRVSSHRMDAGGKGEIFVVAAFIGVFLLVGLYSILGFMAKLWN